jgi:hypothetical protein
VKDRGDLWIPGGEFKKNEPTEVTVLMDDLVSENDPSKYDVTIDIQY